MRSNTSTCSAARHHWRQLSDWSRQAGSFYTGLHIPPSDVARAPGPIAAISPHQGNGNLTRRWRRFPSGSDRTAGQSDYCHICSSANSLLEGPILPFLERFTPALAAETARSTAAQSGQRPGKTVPPGPCMLLPSLPAPWHVPPRLECFQKLPTQSQPSADPTQWFTCML